MYGSHNSAHVAPLDRFEPRLDMGPDLFGELLDGEVSVDDLEVAELNEAFATQSIASMRRLGINPEIVNGWGGAIALGHPLGSSGSRIVITLLSRLEAEEKSRGLATMCVGVGQGAAMLIERV